MREQLKFALIGGAIGLVVGGISAAVGSWLYWRHEVEARDEEIVETCDKLVTAKDVLRTATYELYVTRQAMDAMLEKDLADAVYDHVAYKMDTYAVEHDEFDSPWLIDKVEEHILAHAKADTSNLKISLDAKRASESDRVEAERVVEGLGYRSTLGEELARTMEARMRAIREAAEQNMAEGEYPFEEVGSERLTPNGDILDEAYDEDYDPRTEQYDDRYDSDEEESGEEMVARLDHDDRTKDQPMDKPYIISEAQFLTSYLDHVSVEYFAMDDILMDEDDSVMDQDLIGADNLLEFERTDCPSIFIRNEKIGTDFEVLYNEESYAVMFYDADPASVSGKRIWRSWEERE